MTLYRMGIRYADNRYANSSLMGLVNDPEARICHLKMHLVPSLHNIFSLLVPWAEHVPRLPVLRPSP